MAGGPRAVASVPAKIILMGEHAVVYGRPAIVATLGLRAEVALSAEGRDIRIDLPDLDLRSTRQWTEVLSYAEAMREAWLEYSSRPTLETFKRLKSDQPDHLVQVALGEVARELGERSLLPLSVRIESEIPIGAGFGSSAALAVGVIAGALTVLDPPADSGRVDRLALEVERRLHGMPSGVDHQTVHRGGLFWARKTPGDKIEIEGVAAGSQVLSELHVFHTGAAAETTGMVVEAVRRRKEASPSQFEDLLDRMEVGVDGFRHSLTSPQADSRKLSELIRSYEACLEEIGVVPPAIQATIRQVERAGGAAKISGAGALTGEAAGCLLVHWPEADDKDLPAGLDAYTRHSVALGVDGLHLETDP